MSKHGTLTSFKIVLNFYFKKDYIAVEPLLLNYAHKLTK